MYLEMVPWELFSQDICFSQCFTAMCFVEERGLCKWIFYFFFFFLNSMLFKRWIKAWVQLLHPVPEYNFIFYLMYLGWWIGKWYVTWTCFSLMNVSRRIKEERTRGMDIKVSNIFQCPSCCSINSTHEKTHLPFHSHSFFSHFLSPLENHL